jgi:hypothetical protein
VVATPWHAGFSIRATNRAILPVLWRDPRIAHDATAGFPQDDGNRCGGITYKFCARVEMMLSVAD